MRHAESLVARHRFSYLWCPSSIAVMHGLSCSVACGLFLDRGSNPCLLHWQADSLPLSHQGSPEIHCLLNYFSFQRRWCSSLAAFKIFFFSLVFQSLIVLDLGVYFLALFVWDSHSFLNLLFYVFCQICQVFSHYFLEYFFSSVLYHWDSDNKNVRSVCIATFP